MQSILNQLQSVFPKLNFPDDIESKTFTVATLDIETLSLRQNAVILEVGIIKRVVDYTYQRAPGDYINVQDAEIPSESLVVGCSLIDQLSLNRSVSSDTIRFLQEALGIGTYAEILKNADESVHIALQKVRHALSDCDEVWINHPEFDASILENLSQSLRPDSPGIEYPVAHYRKLHNIHTIRKTLFLETPRGKPAHRAIEDSKWNWEVLEHFGRLRRALVEITKLCSLEKTAHT